MKSRAGKRRIRCQAPVDADCIALAACLPACLPLLPFQNKTKQKQSLCFALLSSFPPSGRLEEEEEEEAVAFRY